MSESGWNTIDSDAGLFTRLVEKLGVKGIQFEDLYSIDSDSLLQLAPIYGIVFLFKYGKVDRESAQNGNDPLCGEYDTNYQENDIFFGNQTIQNACGTQAILNLLLNLDVSGEEGIELGSELSNFKEFVVGFDGEMVGETISNSEPIRAVHNSFSSPPFLVDDMAKPPKDYDDKNDGVFHFIGYLQKNNQIYEFDGLKAYPIVHGECDSSQFIQKIPHILMERIAKYGQELRFSCLVVTNDKLQVAKQLGDEESEAFELRKRQEWDKEIDLRKHDYTNLFVNLIKNISDKTNDEQWNNLMDKGQQKSKNFYSKHM